MTFEADDILTPVLDAGFVRAALLPLAEAGDAGVRAWVACGQHGEMAWMERHVDAKERPADHFGEYRTLVVAALDYGEVAPAPDDPRVGNISRYALGDDYHDVLKRRLHAAADALRAAWPELGCRAFVDTGPINEKLVAARAGLGWVGKHTNLIDTAHGSYHFLGLLLLTADVECRTVPEPDRCGLCEACIPACPTGAITAPYQLDARRCISYLTIELRGPIPHDLRPLIGNRIFGCDDCQEVCPWNRFARRDPPEPFKPRDGLRDRTLAEWLELSREEWRALFRNSAVKRARYEGFLRNVLVAAGCARDPALAGPVAGFLDHPEALLRGHAAWALGRIAPDGGRELLRARLAVERDSWVRVELRQALDAAGGG